MYPSRKWEDAHIVLDMGDVVTHVGARTNMNQNTDQFVG
jgi:hypothetical protein